MVTQYPDSVVITVHAAATQDSNGNWVQGSSTAYTFDCRAEANNKGLKIMGDDGKLMEYTFMCYLPQTTTVIPMGASYVLTTENNGVFTGTVKRNFNGQLNSRLWL